MKRIAFISIYIGKLPEYFSLWLGSCRNNPTVDFIFFTDDNSEYDYPKNVYVNYITFDEIKEIIQKHFDFTVCIETTYKLCDFRPAYGEIFKDYLKNYEFWGHCDIDLIWGDIRYFITDDILDKYIKVYVHGHCSLYKNIEEVNKMYRILKCNTCKDYKEVYTNKTNMCFDERPGIFKIMKENGISIYDNPDFADLDYSRAKFKILRRSEFDKTVNIFLFKDGKVYLLNDKITEEFLYVHFQKRKIEIENIGQREFYMISPGIVTSDKKHVGGEKVI